MDKGLKKAFHKAENPNGENKQANKQKNPKQPNLKLGRRPEQTFFKRRHTDGQKAHEKVLNIANQNYSEVSTCTNQNGHPQKVYK